METELKVKVLLVDDEPNNLISLSAILDFDDIELYQVESGNEALKLLIKNKFGLIISDVRMPEMDGFELLEFIRMDPLNEKTPVILATAYNKEQNFVYKGYEEGAVDYLIKPLEPSVTRSKARVFIDLAKQQIELQRQKEALSELVEQKKKFTGMLAHDIRGPLSVMISYAEILRDERNVTTEEGSKFASNIAQSGKNLLDIIEDLLDLTALDSNDVPLNLTLTDVNEYFKEIFEANRVLANKKRIELHNNFLTSDIQIGLDRTKILQVMNNLISNAIKYSNSGTNIYITITDKGEELCLSVRDEGQGIPESEIPKLFDMYATTSVKGTQGEKSTGLGLFIVDSIVKAHKGTINVKSTVGEGTTFSFTINKALGGELAAIKKVEVPNCSDKRSIETVLIAEDDMMSRKLLTKALEKIGYKVIATKNGEECFLSFQSENPDLIITDINMDDLSGKQLAKQIREGGSDVLIFGLTADTRSSEKEECIASGMDSVIYKPFQKSDLQQLIEQYKV